MVHGYDDEGESEKERAKNKRIFHTDTVRVYLERGEVLLQPQPQTLPSPETEYQEPAEGRSYIIGCTKNDLFSNFVTDIWWVVQHLNISPHAKFEPN